MPETYSEIIAFGRHSIAIGDENGVKRITILLDHVYGPSTLNELGLTPSSIPENSANGTFVGQVTGLTGGSTPSLTDNAGGRFAISSTGVITVANGLLLDYETATSHSITVRETLASATNTPLDTVLNIDITNVADAAPLTSLGGTFTLPENAAADTFAGTITGKTSGSELSLIDDAGGRVALLGTNIVRGATALDYETATSHSFSVRETLSGAPNSPFDTAFSLVVTDITEGGGSGTIVTPVIDVSANVPGDEPPAWTVNFVEPGPDGADYGDTIQLQYGTSAVAMAAMTPIEEILDEGELIDGEALFATEFDAWASAQVVGTTLYWRVRVVRVAGVEESDWSDTVTYLLADGIANTVAFTDVTDAALSTLTWSAPIVIAGLGSGCFSRFTVEAGGFLRVNGGASIDSTGEAIVQNGDTLAVGVTSSGVAGIPIEADVFQRGSLYDTFSVTTAGAGMPTDDALLLDASDLSTLFQNIAGSTAVTTDGQPVGKWNDKSGNGFHLTAVADDTTRPTYKTSAGKHWVLFDGVNDFLRILNSLGTYAAGAATIGLAMRSTSPTTADALVSWGNTGNSNNVYNPVMTEAGTASRLSARASTSTGTSIIANTSDLASGAFDGNAKTVIVTDSGSVITGYLDNVIGAEGPFAYTRSGTVTHNIMGIGAFARGTPTSFFQAEVYALVIFNRVLDSTERAALHAFLEGKLP